MKKENENNTTNTDGGDLPAVWTPENALKNMGFSNWIPGLRKSLPKIVIMHKTGNFDIGLGERMPKTLDIVGITHAFKRSFYGQIPDDTVKAPMCYSHDGISPHSKVIEPESDSCGTCDWSDFNTAKNKAGDLLPGQACKSFVTLVCLIMGYRDVSQDSIFLKPAIPWELIIPPSSLKAYEKMVKEMEVNGYNLPLFPINISLEINNGTNVFSRLKFTLGNDFITRDERKWGIFNKWYFENAKTYLNQSFVNQTQKVFEESEQQEQK